MQMLGGPDGGYLVLNVGALADFDGTVDPSSLTLEANAVVKPIRARSESGVYTQTLTGMNGGTDGRIVILVNASGGCAVETVAESGLAAAADRFHDAFSMDPDESRWVIYDGSRWRVL
jgi:hypothetical protein